MLKSTPPIGAPKSLATPTAQAAASVSRRRASLNLMLAKMGTWRRSCSVMMLLMWTKGPSLPIGSPLLEARSRPTILEVSVLKDKYSLRAMPLRISFISGMPDPMACGEIRCVHATASVAIAVDMTTQ